MVKVNIEREHFYEKIKESYMAYLKYGSRSTQKLKPIHKWLGETYQNVLGKEYNVYFIDGKEIQVKGRYYPKIVDIGIQKNKKDVFVVSFKFITSNYKQNVNNFFENLLGECANIQSKNIGFGHIMVLRNKIPYFDKKGEIKKWEVPEDKDLFKYIKLFEDKNIFVHAPYYLSIEIVSISPIIEEKLEKGPMSGGIRDKENIHLYADVNVSNGVENTSLSEEIRKYLNEEMNIQKFFEKT